MKRLMFITLLFLCACTIKSGNKEISFMQMQVRKGSASVSSTKLYGTKITVPMTEYLGSLEFILGYVSKTDSLVPTKPDGSLPDICLDTTQETGDTIFSDTFSTGESSKLYQEQEKEVAK